jgi:hypothetical protein
MTSIMSKRPDATDSETFLLATELIEHHPISLPIDPRKLQFFTDLLKNGHVFEPVAVSYLSFTGGHYVLREGRHTFEAHKLLKIPTILART